MLGDSKGGFVKRRRGSQVSRLGLELGLLNDVFRPPSLSPRLISPVVIRPAVRAVEDRRTYHPMGFLRPAAALVKSSGRIIAKSSASPMFADDISARVGFAVPSRVAICVRRHTRKEVLHANGVAGSNRVSRVRRRTRWSDVEC